MFTFLLAGSLRTVRQGSLDWSPIPAIHGASGTPIPKLIERELELLEADVNSIFESQQQRAGLNVFFNANAVLRVVDELLFLVHGKLSYGPAASSSSSSSSSPSSSLLSSPLASAAVASRIKSIRVFLLGCYSYIWKALMRIQALVNKTGSGGSRWDALYNNRGALSALACVADRVEKIRSDRLANCGQEEEEKFRSLLNTSLKIMVSGAASPPLSFSHLGDHLRGLLLHMHCRSRLQIQMCRAGNERGPERLSRELMAWLLCLDPASLSPLSDPSAQAVQPCVTKWRGSENVSSSPTAPATAAATWPASGARCESLDVSRESWESKLVSVVSPSSSSSSSSSTSSSSSSSSASSPPSSSPPAPPLSPPPELPLSPVEVCPVCNEVVALSRSPSLVDIIRSRCPKGHLCARSPFSLRILPDHGLRGITCAACAVTFSRRDVEIMVGEVGELQRLTSCCHLCLSMLCEART
jgi:hypothetical protein